VARRTLLGLLLGCLWLGSSVSGAGAVVGGSQAQPGQWPFAAALIDASINDTLSGQICGAIVVSAREVLTAAHCVTPDGSARPRRRPLDIVAGRLRLRGAAAARVHVVSVRIHPQFNPATLADDLALLELSRPVAGAATLDDGSIGQSGRAAGAAGSRATALGWGSTTASPEGTFPDALRQTEIDIEPDSACSAVYGDGFDAASMLCAGVPQGGHDTCQGDSGGPLVAGADQGTPVVVGLTSFGGTCGQPDAPGAYARASVAAGWLAAGATTSADRATTLPQRHTQLSGVRPIAKPQRSRARSSQRSRARS
jgi:secreted trypsin-like serine protease